MLNVVFTSNNKPQLILQDAQLTEGNELTKEIYRWDQRLFSVVLRLPGMGGPSTNPKDPLLSEVALSKLAEATGGELFRGVDMDTLKLN